MFKDWGFGVYGFLLVGAFKITSFLYSTVPQKGAYSYLALGTVAAGFVEGVDSYT